MVDEKGRILAGRYALIPPSKTGGMADVYKASDLQAGGLHVAVKLLRYSANEEEILAESFRRETDALRQLEHPNIVRLIDTGQDDESGRSFLVLEWFEQDLSEYLTQHSFDTWQDFYDYVGRPVLEALEFAHSRRFSHRDLKPSNVLLTEGSSPKLADFGIAKLHSFMQPGVTLADFSSRPYSPPEPDEGLRPFARDLYGFAVVALESLAGKQFRERTDIESAVSELSLPEAVRTSIHRCTALDPAERPAHAGVLLTELNSIASERERKDSSPTLCWVEVPKKYAQKLQASLEVSSVDEVQQRLSSELRGPCAIEPKQKSGKSVHVDQHYMIHASSCSMHVAVDKASNDHLYAFNAWSVSQSECEHRREVAWVAPFSFKLGRPKLRSKGEEAIRRLKVGVEEHQSELRLLRAQREEQRLFTTWGGLLRARLELERLKNPPIQYHDRQVKGRRVEFSVHVPPKEEWEGTPWKSRLPDGSVVRGELEDVASDAVTLWVTKGEADQIPEHGRLEFDASVAEIALSRQQKVLDSVRFRRAVHPTLRDLLVKPADCRPPQPVDTVEFAQDDLDKGKKAAVLKALGVQDFVVVEGPPGTGKTTFIAELVIQLLRRDPSVRILLTSQTHVALDNALERIRKLASDTSMVRLASRYAAPRVAESVRDLLPDNALGRWQKTALAKAEQFLETLADELGVSRQDTHVGLLLLRLISEREQLRDSEHQLEEARTRLADSERDPNLVMAAEQQELLADEVSRWREEVKIQKKQLKELEKRVQREELIGVN